MKPAAVAAVHRDICERERCEHLDKLNYADPCVACPNGHFGIYSRALCNGDSASDAMPNRITMAKNAVVAIGAVVHHGIKKVSDEERARRLSICEACEFVIRKEGKASHCAKCGCFLKWKTALETWHCPIQKW